MQLALLERAHDRLFLGRFHAPVHQADIQLRQRQLQLFPGGFRRLGLQQIRLFNQRTNPVGLATLVSTGVPYPVDNIAAAGIRDGYRRNRRTARRQFIDDRGVEIGISGHRQGPRNRRRGHNQLVRVKALLLAFLP